MTAASIHALPSLVPDSPTEPCAGFLDALGFAGLEALELPMACSLATGDPLLMVGRHGSAKSAVARAVARALGMRFHAYDASKALFEDVIGFPDPASLAEGTVRYVPTPLSLWDKEFLLVDELSRASPALQNKWLEIVRDRAVMGLRAERLRCVWAAMNPTGYAGATALDEALAGRFPWVLPMPDVGDFEPDAVERVIRAVSSLDAPLAPAFRSREQAAALGLLTLVEALRAELPETLRQHDDPVVAWVRELGQAFSGGAGALDGRRMGMLRRNALTALAYDRVTCGERDRHDLLLDVLRGSLPHPATGAEVGDTEIFLAHEAAWERSFGGGGRVRAVDRVLSARTQDDLLARYLGAVHDLSELEHDRVIERILAPVADLRDGPRIAAAFTALRLVREVLADASRFPPETAARVGAWGGRLLGIGGAGESRVTRTASGLRGTRNIDGVEALSLRLAVELSKDQPGADERVDVEEARKLIAGIRPRAELMLRPQAGGGGAL